MLPCHQYSGFPATPAAYPSSPRRVSIFQLQKQLQWVSLQRYEGYRIVMRTYPLPGDASRKMGGGGMTRNAYSLGEPNYLPYLQRPARTQLTLVFNPE
jgi:hypothetical protein